MCKEREEDGREDDEDEEAVQLRRDGMTATGRGRASVSAIVAHIDRVLARRPSFRLTRPQCLPTRRS